jgi:hypothetical protein
MPGGSTGRRTSTRLGGVRVEGTHGLADADEPFASPVVAGGFVTDGKGFGHVVFATTASDASPRVSQGGQRR